MVPENRKIFTICLKKINIFSQILKSFLRNVCQSLFHEVSTGQVLFDCEAVQVLDSLFDVLYVKPVLI